MEKEARKLIEQTEFKATVGELALASCFGAVVTSFFVTPLDVVKTRMQAQQTGNLIQEQGIRFRGTMDAFQKIARYEGIINLWSGLNATLLLTIPTTVVYFAVYEQLRIMIRTSYYQTQTVSMHHQPIWVSVVSGALARVVTASVVSPLELVKTKVQSENITYMQVAGAINLAIKKKGYVVLWRGVFPTLLRDVTFSSLFWLYYESLKNMYDRPHPSFGFSFIASAVSGTVASLATVPFDVVKTNQQIDFRNGKSSSTWIIMWNIYKRHGIPGLFAGLAPRLLRVVPACALTMGSIEYMKHIIKDHYRSKRPS